MALFHVEQSHFCTLSAFFSCIGQSANYLSVGYCYSEVALSFVPLW